MTTNTRTRYAATIAIALAIGAFTMTGAAAGQKFYADDPVWVERDTEDASAMTPYEQSLFVDFTSSIIQGFGDVVPGRARNINTVDEVPDSSWFTNRLGHRAITPEEMAVGPNRTSGPVAGQWTITSSKSDGITPGFTIKDATGQRWFLKFDPRGYQGMATGTEVLVTKLMWALGYHVPENHIAFMRRDQLVVGSTATFSQPGGRKRPMRLSDVDNLLKRAEESADGTYRVVASRALEGKPIGRIRFFDTRPDDPNDIVAHEDRRELRGYGVFAAWLNHTDAKAINSLDTLITENGRSFVRHHLIDFGSSLGSAGIGPADEWAGTQHVVDMKLTARQMVGFGFSFPEWHTAEYYEAPSIGRLPRHNAGFDPEAWKPRVPNRAFMHSRSDDKFWAAQKLVAMTTDLIRAAIKTAQFGDSTSEAFLATALAERRDAIARAYLTAVNPVADVALGENDTLTFRNAAVDADVARAPKGYRAVWSMFDNVTGDITPLGESTGRATAIAAPDLPHDAGVYIKVQVSAIDPVHASWQTPVDAYFQHTPTGWTLVGFERMPESRPSIVSTN
jgi:hypothetical protein